MLEDYVPKKPNIVETHAPPPIRSKTDFDFVAPAPPTSKTAGQTPPQKPISCKPAGSKAPLNTTQAGIDSSNYDRTVFVSNLDFAVIDETIRTIFEENVGQVTSVRLIMLRPGRSKGFGYVEFKEPSLLIEALKLDRYKIDGRPMYVSKCVDKKSNDQQSSSSSNIPPHGFTYSTGIEKNKLFIKNLNGRTTEADLEKIFKLYGHLVSVRLVIHKSGQSKGLAYVEFADEQSANRALMATDQSTLMGRRITVAISNPPPKQTKIGGEDQIQRDRSPSTATINLSMTPRVLSSNTTQKRPHLNSGMNRQNGGDSMIENQSTTVNGSGTNVGKSNDEFRKMIMK
uniref:RRM domain-containing protein n=1 Tax=Romanomermis culicivorax TaxID=13658 RepID=A0A915K6C4_ROMCU